ncbi:MAG: hypothetical protein ACK52U_01150 [Synechococcaceae cyanobacterium]
MAAALILVLAPAEALPDDTASRSQLEGAQRQGPAGGSALRLFKPGRDTPASLPELPLNGRLTGDQRRSPDGCQLLCDAVVPHFEPQLHWLGVYQALDEDLERFVCLDRMPLRELGSETCWFYPTHDGLFLSWERSQRLLLGPGRIADAPAELLNSPYERGRLQVLWSLFADDTSLTCVGLTYGGQRIDWPILWSVPESVATWSRFRVDSSAETSLVVEESHSQFADPLQPPASPEEF